MTDAPLFANALYGLRSWRVAADERGEWLAAPHQSTRWPAGGEWLVATCPKGHAAPASGCDCGAHAWHPRRSSARRVLAARRDLAGVIEARGPTEVHENGFRAERARPYALFAAPGSNTLQIVRLAGRYGAEVAEISRPDDVLAWCRERGLGMDEAVVADLLGSGSPDERRRARFRTGARDALRVALAFAVAVALVLVGQAVISDPPGERTLYGRTGEVQRP